MNKKMNVELTEDEWNIVLQCLVKAPFEVVNNVIQNILTQIQNQKTTG